MSSATSKLLATFLRCVASKSARAATARVARPASASRAAGVRRRPLHVASTPGDRRGRGRVAHVDPRPVRVVLLVRRTAVPFVYWLFSSEQTCHAYPKKLKTREQRTCASLSDLALSCR